MSDPRPEGSEDQVTCEALKLAAGVELDRPVDRVIRRLECADAEEWFTTFLARGPLSVFQDPEDALVNGRSGIDHLIALKNRAKTFLRESPESDEALYGILGYFLASAGALLHHGRLISSSRREDLDPMLLDLAGVLPDAYSQLLARAAFVDRS